MAYKSVRNIEPGVKWRQVVEIRGGVYPNATTTFLSLACICCGEPACIKGCHTGAISKRAKDGIVVVDKDKCNGCRDCFSVCPYGVPQFGENGIMQMCDFCTGINIEPACEACCPTGALKFDNLDELLEMAKGKGAKKMDGHTEPSIIITVELPIASLVRKS